MAQIKPEWEEIPEFIDISRMLIEKYEETLGHVDPDLLIAYKCTNKSKPESRTKLYDMSGQTEPEAFTNTKKYFIKVFHDVWDTMDQKNRQLIVLSALRRIDSESPDSGKVGGYDMHDQAMMIRTFGPDWATRSDVPDIINQTVRLVEEPKID